MAFVGKCSRFFQLMEWIFQKIRGIEDAIQQAFTSITRMVDLAKVGDSYL